ncbi:DUF1684 domain-containing protein [Dyadobacter sp. CY345]|uniref:DUF1684 domain-containing protein n=1 Tax=Dyadobacter sp. CY345 TaxID=2909335 RepID=UPI001F46DB18|nr:DUF1684 domain-containing protein [Dyadobacter sp. CY345]MCF2447322.1 DUF1684 domain-containing protein [Dyadobacter sp. CY345]
MTTYFKVRTSRILGLIALGFASLSFVSDSAYESEIKAWHKEREEALKKENGWLNLAGLFWLEEGRNSFGGDGKNKIVFPPDKSPAYLGAFIVKSGQITLEAKPEAEIYYNDQPAAAAAVTKLDIFPSDKAVILKHKSLRWFIIKRGDKFAVRLKDLESPFLKEFKGIETYPISEDWKVKAKFEPTEGRKIPIIDITGRLDQQDSPGVLVFNIKGKEYRLDALKSGEGFFILFGDNTNKNVTYGSGRFIYTQKLDAEGYTYLDFNKAINPPCAFTPYATCPLPPKQNILAVSVTAGEKKYGHH